jgi:hypothetical protein
MSKTSKASVSNVGQAAPRQKAADAPRTIKISVRLAPSIVAMKPPEVSWGDFITRELTRHDGSDRYRWERVRYSAWAATCLDYIVKNLDTRLPVNGDVPVGAQMNRLAAMASLVEEIAHLRRQMEHICHAR